MKVKIDYFDWTTFIAQKQHVGDSDKRHLHQKKQQKRTDFIFVWTNPLHSLNMNIWLIIQG